MLTYINQTVQYVWRAILKYKNRTTLYRKIWTGINYLLPQGYFIAGTHTTQRICVQCNVFNDLQGLFWGSNRVSEVKILSFFIRHFQWVKLLVCVKLYVSGKTPHSGQRVLYSGCKLYWKGGRLLNAPFKNFLEPAI